ncbi:uncharacterized protein LOC127838147 [Dreissena polymorpha]|uniref:EF-hand domain-containing protein n=1 Tax=Dreissena polymorpha TaxID=45954 RepID=A0A9D4J900_DREPO|nr:uncharacterized protein LOC127838147 [Dreissena polymorpha]KAH3799908.1 hypothetical protein DPMN_153530 [Dreissena polymorpha]
MLRILVCLVAVFGSSWQVTLPHGHELKVAIDQQFAALDLNHNGILEFSELAAFGAKEDANHDGQVNLQEYMTFLNLPLEIGQPIFNVYDKDKDGFINQSFLTEYYHLLDHNNDNSVSLHEYEQYISTFLACVFGADHGGHGHGPNCDH